MDRSRSHDDSGRLHGRRGRSTAFEDLLHLLVVGQTGSVFVVLRIGRLPQHDTTKDIRVPSHIPADKRVHLTGFQIVTLVGGSGGGGKTDEELGVRVGAGLDDGGPFIEVEVAGTVGEVASRAPGGVVELHPDEIESGIGDGTTKLSIGSGTLGSRGDVELLVGVLLEAESKTIDHSLPAYAGVCEHRVMMFGLSQRFQSPIELSRKEKTNVPTGPPCSISKSNPSTELSPNGRGY